MNWMLLYIFSAEKLSYKQVGNHLKIKYLWTNLFPISEH